MGSSIFRAATLGVAAVVAAAVLTAVLAAASVAPARAQTPPRKHTTEAARKAAEARARARITVERRSFLDAGTEVLPGQRKFTDYAFPPGYSSTAVIDFHGGIHPGPLPTPFDVPGHYPGNIGLWSFPANSIGPN